MRTFAYQAVDVAGRVSSGRVDGESEVDVIRGLEQRSLTPLQVRPARDKSEADDGPGKPTRIRLPLKDLLQFTRQLKVMLGSGVTLLTTLGLLHRQARGDYKRLLERVAADIQRGTSLGDALAAHPRTFDSFYLGTIRAGEAAGLHTEALDELIAFYERRAALRREIVGALTYPAIVVLILIAACVVMLVFVVPQFESIFNGMKAALPLPTRILLIASKVVTQHWGKLLAGLAAAVAGFWFGLRSPQFRTTCGRLLANIPLVGTVVRMSGVVMFSRMIALLERAGMPLLETLSIVEQMLMPGPLRQLTGVIRRKVAAGGSIGSAVEGSDVLPELVQQMISVGETTGKIDETLMAAAAHFEEEMRVKMKRLTVALEPLLTVMVSTIVLGVALAIFLPMWEMNSLMLKR